MIGVFPMHLKLAFRVLFGTAIAFSGWGMLQPNVCSAQLDVFENNNNRKPPPRRGGMSFGGSGFSVGGTGGRREVRQGSIFYSQGNYAAASLKFYRVVKKYSGSRLRLVAEFQLAKCLYRLKLYQPAMRFFTQVVQGGRQHPHFRDAVVFLAEIGAQIKNYSFLSKMSGFSPADLPRKYRNQLFYMLGRYYFSAPNLSPAKRLPISLRLLAKVRTNEPKYYARAQYIMGAIYDAAKNPNQASVYFRRAGRSALRIKDKKIRQNVVELAILGLARIHYGAKHFRGAIRYYKAIHRSSPRWLDSLFEMAYSYLRRGKYGHSLGILHTLDSPYFRNQYYPEAGILKALSFFGRCRYARTKKIIKTYQRRYKPLVQAISSFLRANPTPRRIFGALLRLRNQEATQGLDNDESGQMFQRILNLSFQDKTIKRYFVYIKELDRELGMLGSFPTVWQSSRLARSIKSNLSSERIKYVVRAGTRARSRFQGAKSEVQEFISQALKILYETYRAEKTLMNRSIQQRGGFKMRRRGTSRRKRNLITVSTHEDYIFWPFQGEYWVDELGYYRYRIRGECRKP